MEKDIAVDTALGLQLNRLFLAIQDRANKKKVIDFARSIVEAEREQRLGASLEAR